MNTTYDGRKSKGLCVDCGLEKPREGRIRCVRCSDILSRREKERREARKKASLCIYCGKPVVGSMVTCAPCRDRIIASLEKKDRHQIVAKATKKLRNKRRNGHMCIRCGTQLEDGYLHVCCPKCIEESNKAQTRMYHKRVLDHRCTRCGVQLEDGYSYRQCKKCRDHLAESRRRKREFERSNSEVVNWIMEQM